MPVLVGFVPTTEGRAALRRAVEECRVRGTRLIVVGSDQQQGEVYGERRAAPVESEAEVRRICGELGLTDDVFETRWIEGAYEPADDVLAVAEETGADLIVIGLRRRTGVGKRILGGSAQRILLDSSCPVLAVKVDARAVLDDSGHDGEVYTLSVNSADERQGIR
ncbi:universal stress protein [Kineosporia succinea]|uniref:Nucleotide-binding universal stress UspA family protein n=1 Tax=Kineosporia succinea TaxID=84632 RepID=A0ABT9NXH8_9ACTN|nr:universal stress protein [Kineosporia succinea]MDP9824555.1 nucleotide-binding universal stress UspA family protein [Kineosporia succinea]